MRDRSLQWLTAPCAPCAVCRCLRKRLRLLLPQSAVSAAWHIAWKCATDFSVSQPSVVDMTNLGGYDTDMYTDMDMDMDMDVDMNMEVCHSGSAAAANK